MQDTQHPTHCEACGRAYRLKRNPGDPFSQREHEVIDLVCKGLSNAAIGEKLFITEKTVKFHLTNIFKKHSVKSRQELIIQMHNRRLS